MGLADMFSDSAEFTGTADTRLKIGNVVQKVSIEIDEMGSKETAAAGEYSSFNSKYST